MFAKHGLQNYFCTNSIPNWCKNSNPCGIACFALLAKRCLQSVRIHSRAKHARNLLANSCEVLGAWCEASTKHNPCVFCKARKFLPLHPLQCEARDASTQCVLCNGGMNSGWNWELRIPQGTQPFAPNSHAPFATVLFSHRAKIATHAKFCTPLKAKSPNTRPLPLAGLEPTTLKRDGA